MLFCAFSLNNTHFSNNNIIVYYSKFCAYFCYRQSRIFKSILEAFGFYNKNNLQCTRKLFFFVLSVCLLCVWVGKCVFFSTNASYVSFFTCVSNYTRNSIYFSINDVPPLLVKYGKAVTQGLGSNYTHTCPSV